MSISQAFAKANPRCRAFYADGVYKCVAALCLGASGDLLTKCIDKARMKFILQEPIKSATVIFTRTELLESYKADIAGLVGVFPMNGSTAEVTLAINQYIYRMCELNNIVSERLVSSAVMFCINTLYFKDKWVNTFNSSDTIQQAFHGTKLTTVPMMHQTDKIQCYVDRTIQAVKLPFANGAYAEFVMGLPIDQEIGNISYKQQLVALGLPRFEHTEQIDLIPLLMDVGLQDLFKSGNLANISGDSAMFISTAFQVISCSFDEQGAEVKAVTVFAATRSARPTPINIKFNKPFHYCIKKGDTTIVSGYYDTN